MVITIAISQVSLRQDPNEKCLVNSLIYEDIMVEVEEFADIDSGYCYLRYR